MKKIKVPILNNEYFVYVLVGNLEEMIKWINSYYPSTHYGVEDFEEYRGNVFYHKGYYPTITINDKDLRRKNHFWATVSHEAVHAIQYIFEEIGEENAEEVFAHSVAAVVSAVEKFIKERNGKR